MKDIYILGIESSCDDTCAAVLKNGVLLSNVTASQEVHQRLWWRGSGAWLPVPTSRMWCLWLTRPSARAGIKKEDLSAVAFTRGPGLDGFAARGRELCQGLRPFAQHSDD